MPSACAALIEWACGTARFVRMAPSGADVERHPDPARRLLACVVQTSRAGNSTRGTIEERYRLGGVMLRLALIAHDNKKVDLVAWSTFNRDTLAQFILAATGHTAQLMRDKVGLEVEPLLSGPQGGDAQIAARVAEARIDAVFFFVDPLSAQPHDPDIRALLRVCNVHNVPLATNLASADLIIAGLAAGLRPRGAANDLND